MLNRALLFIMALCLGELLQKLHIPIPFLLGGMVTAILCKTFNRRPDLTWPKKWREYGLMVAGYGIGSTFNASTWSNLVDEIAGVAEATVIIIGCSVLLALITARLAREDLKSCIWGMMPGGLTISMLIAEEDKSTNPNIIVVMQIIRLFSVVLSVPFLVIIFLDAQVTGSSVAMPNHGGYHWLCLVPLSVLGGYIAGKIHMPTPNMLGPILMTAVFSVAAGTLQPVPGVLMACAQVSIGLFMGLQLDAGRISRTRNILPYIFIGTALMIAVSVFTAGILSQRYGFTLVTAFLAMAPGGIAEMSLAGMSMGEDVSIILTYQLVRVLAINIFVPVLMKIFFRDGAEA